jgi:hypothetical protein
MTTHVSPDVKELDEMIEDIRVQPDGNDYEYRVFVSYINGHGGDYYGLTLKQTIDKLKYLRYLVTPLAQIKIERRPMVAYDLFAIHTRGID